MKKGIEKDRVPKCVCIIRKRGGDRRKCKGTFIETFLKPKMLDSSIVIVSLYKFCFSMHFLNSVEMMLTATV